ncbi:MAG: transporter associated domain-containing protein [Alphaproteobacteria bacterium]|jgi:magnesium and cobalt transporter|nr:CBS domain-containing protein [Alphaproteobacteria bacterium]
MIKFLKKVLFRNKATLSRRHKITALLAQNEPEPASLDREECYLLSNILKLHYVTADDVKVPRVEIKAVSRDVTLEELAAAVAKTPYTRFIVYGQDIDDIRGFIRVKDIYQFLDKAKPFSLKTITRKILFISPSRSVLHLLMQMKASQIPLAVVVDELGGVDGLVTYGDIVRAIVGDIDDVSLEDTLPALVKTEEKVFEADARLPIETLMETFSLTLSAEQEDDDIETLGGLIVSLLGRVPDRFEIVTHPQGLTFEILEVNPRRVLKVRIRDTR